MSTAAFKHGCLGKHHYGTAGAAREAKARLKYGKNLRVYQCEFCAAWHIGTTNETTDGRAAKRTR